MKKTTANRLAWAALSFSLLPVSLFVVGYGDPYFNPASSVPEGQAGDPLCLGLMITDAIFQRVIIEIAAFLAIAPCVLAVLALVKKTDRRWAAITAVLVNGPLVLMLVGQIVLNLT